MLKNQKGFTLIELVVVIVILGILMGIAVPSYLHFVDEAKKTVALANSRTMFNQVTLALTTDITKPNAKEIIRWTKTPANKSIIYKGPTDNSVTKPTGYHDGAKNAIKNIMGNSPIEFGYRMYFSTPSTISTIDVFYKKPTNAGITAAKPDFSIN